MFLPGRNADQEKQQKQKNFKNIEKWCEALLPENVKSECTVSVQEIQCGDPNCAPIDTAISLIFQRCVPRVLLLFLSTVNGAR